MDILGKKQVEPLHVKIIRLGAAAQAVADGIATHAQKEQTKHDERLRQLGIARSLNAKVLPYGQSVRTDNS